MKNNFKKFFVLPLIIFMGFSHILYTQSLYKINDSKDNNMKLSGTSTFHNWVMNTGTLSGNAQFDFKEGTINQLSSVKSLTFSLLVQNLKSGESGLDDNAYKAMKTDQYKDILYTLLSAKVSPSKDNKFLIKTVGNLVIAGVSKKVSMDVYCIVNADGSITSMGSYKLKMTDYNVKPPTFMLGVMKTGNEITLDFNMVYKKQAGI